MSEIFLFRSVTWLRNRATRWRTVPLSLFTASHIWETRTADRLTSHHQFSATIWLLLAALLAGGYRTRSPEIRQFSTVRPPTFRFWGRHNHINNVPWQWAAFCWKIMASLGRYDWSALPLGSVMYSISDSVLQLHQIRRHYLLRGVAGTRPSPQLVSISLSLTSPTQSHQTSTFTLCLLLRGSFSFVLNDSIVVWVVNSLSYSN